MRTQGSSLQKARHSGFQFEASHMVERSWVRGKCADRANAEPRSLRFNPTTSLKADIQFPFIQTSHSGMERNEIYVENQPLSKEAGRRKQ